MSDLLTAYDAIMAEYASSPSEDGESYERYEDALLDIVHAFAEQARRERYQQATTADLPPFPVPSVHPAPRRYSARLAGLSGGKYGVWDTETKSWVRITGKSPSAAELLADELNAGSIKL